MNKLLATTPDEVFGVVTPPPGSEAFVDPVAGLGRLIAVAINFLIIVAALFVLWFLLQGAFLWITSNGEDDKLQAARSQMTNAVIGLIMIFVALTIFGLVTGNVLGIILWNDAGWTIKIPTLAP